MLIEVATPTPIPPAKAVLARNRAQGGDVQVDATDKTAKSVANIPR